MLRPCFAVLLVSSLFPITLTCAQAPGEETQKKPGAHAGACNAEPQGDASPSLCIAPAVEDSLAMTLSQMAAPACVPAPEPAEVDLIVPEGTALRIALDRRTRISHPGTEVHGTVVETVYAFDQAVIPEGSVATGHVVEVEGVPGVRRALAYSNGDLSPAHHYKVTFDTVMLPDGRHLSIATTVSPGTAEIVHLVSHEEQKKRSAAAHAKESAKQEVQGKIHDAEEQLHQSWQVVSAPGRMQRLHRWFLAQLLYRRQYLEPGTRFNADLERAVSFGREERTSADLAALASALEPNTTLKARLTSEVSSAASSRGTRVDAVLTEPLYSPAHQLVLPANSHIVGQVVQAKAAGKFHHNGELRLIFERIEIPAEAQHAADEAARNVAAANARQVADRDGARPELARRSAMRMTGNLEGVEVDRREHMTLDEEGGAHTTDSKTRYLSTGAAILLAAAASHPDTEHGTVDNAGDPGVRTAAGGSGFRFTGALISLAAKSSPVSIAFGVYGASASVYSNFLSRGHEVVFPKDTPLEIGFGAPHPAASPAN